MDLAVASRYRANDENDHATGCKCDLCDAVAAGLDPDDVREEWGCDKVGFSPEIQQYAHMYTLIAEGHVDPTDRPMVWIEVAMIGDRVTGTAKAERFAQMDTD